MGRRAKTGAHRYSYDIHHGPIPDGLVVCHRCDTKMCVNPAHLFLGTHKDNTADMVAKGRWAGGVTRGTDSPNAKLNEADVRAIRTLQGKERQVDTAARYGVTQVMVSRIQRRKSWAHVA